MSDKHDPLQPEQLAELQALSSSVLSDALDALGLSGFQEALGPLVPGTKLIGPAVTVRYLPVGISGGTVGDYMDVPQTGDVLVLDNGGRLDCTVWGGILSEVASAKGLAGTVIHGVCRDVEVTRALDYPMFTRGTYMVTGKDRVAMEGINEPVSIGRTRVEPGDLVFGDDMGVVIVPRVKLGEVLAAARQIHGKEEAIVNEVRKGASLREARGRHGYHGLQKSKT